MSKLLISLGTMLQILAHKTEYRLWWKSHNLCLFYTRQPNLGTYSFNFVKGRSAIVVYVSCGRNRICNLNVKQDFKLTRTCCNLLRSNCQSEYQCYSRILKVVILKCYWDKNWSFYFLNIFTIKPDYSFGEDSAIILDSD